MKHEVLLLCSIIAATSLAQIVEHTEPIQFELIERSCKTTDTESLIACQKPVDLSPSTQADLEMIPGISSAMAEKIIEAKAELIRASQNLHPELRYAALTKIKGISFKKAYHIGQYLRIN